MTIDYSVFGFDKDQAVVDAAKNRAVATELAATEAEINAEIEDDPEDKAILAERAADARRSAEDAKTASRLTKGELAEARNNALRAKLHDTVHAHLMLETSRAQHDGKEQVIASIDGQQANLERHIEIIARLLGISGDEPVDVSVGVADEDSPTRQ